MLFIFLNDRHGGRHPHRGHFSNGTVDVPGGNIADRQRLCLLEAVERRGVMNIVVWKAPKAMRGLLRKLFRIQA